MSKAKTTHNKKKSKLENTRLLDFYDKIFTERKTSENLSFNTVLKWKNARNKLEVFLEDTKQLNIRIKQIDIPFLERYRTWLYRSNSSSKNLPRLKTSTVNLTLSKLSTVIKAAAVLQLIPETTARYKFKSAEDIREVSYLTTEEIEKIMGSNYKLAYVSFTFKLQLLTGLRIGDVSNLRKSDVTGKDFMEIRQEKVGKHVIIPISKQLKSLIEDIKECYPEGIFLIPNLRHNKEAINRHLKTWFQELKIRKEKAHTHTARHSFACKLVRNNVSLYIVSKLLGHSKISTCEKYYSTIDKESLRKVLENQGCTDATVKENVVAGKTPLNMECMDEKNSHNKKEPEKPHTTSNNSNVYHENERQDYACKGAGFLKTFQQKMKGKIKRIYRLFRNSEKNRHITIVIKL